MDEALVEVATSIEQANRQIRKINILTRGGVLTREGCPTGASASEEVRSRMLTYAHVCWRMLAHAGACWRMLAYADLRHLREYRCATSMLPYAAVCCRMLPYAAVCCLPYAAVC
jgi:hypothetical protein